MRAFSLLMSLGGEGHVQYREVRYTDPYDCRKVLMCRNMAWHGGWDFFTGVWHYRRIPGSSARACLLSHGRHTASMLTCWTSRRTWRHSRPTSPPPSARFCAGGDRGDSSDKVGPRPAQPQDRRLAHSGAPPVQPAAERQITIDRADSIVIFSLRMLREAGRADSALPWVTVTMACDCTLIHDLPVDSSAAHYWTSDAIAGRWPD